VTTRSIALFIAAAIAEIGGAYLVWVGIKEHKGVAFVALGAMTLTALVESIRSAQRNGPSSTSRALGCGAMRSNDLVCAFSGRRSVSTKSKVLGSRAPTSAWSTTRTGRSSSAAM
jgi:Uncharacterised BCR, YnfA/UPF0060 family